MAVNDNMFKDTNISDNNLPSICSREEVGDNCNKIFDRNSSFY